MDKRVVFLELGVGYNTPGIIKYPFWRMTAANPRAVYACVNKGEAVCPRELEGRAVCVDGDIGEVLEILLRGNTDFVENSVYNKEKDGED